MKSPWDRKKPIIHAPAGRRLLPALLLFFSAAVAQAQNAAAPGPALFKLETGQTVMYFFGSVHVGAPDLFPLPEAVMKAFAASDHLVVELNILETNAGAVAGLVQEKLTYPSGDSIEKHLSPETIAKVNSALKQYGLSLSSLKMFKPGVVDMILTELSAQAAGYQARDGIDLHLLNAANESGKAILELESVAEQIEAIAEIPEDIQILVLEDFLDEIDTIEEDLTRLLELWRNGDLDGLHALQDEDIREEPRLRAREEILVAARNRRMAERLKAMIERGGTYFVVVGALHFAGPGSVLELLRQSGYTITRR